MPHPRARSGTNLRPEAIGHRCLVPSPATAPNVPALRRARSSGRTSGPPIYSEAQALDRATALLFAFYQHFCEIAVGGNNLGPRIRAPIPAGIDIVAQLADLVFGRHH